MVLHYPGWGAAVRQGRRSFLMMLGFAACVVTFVDNGWLNLQHIQIAIAGKIVAFTALLVCVLRTFLN